MSRKRSQHRGHLPGSSTMHQRSVRLTRNVQVIPPSREEMKLYAKRNLNFLRIPSVISFTCLMVSQIFFG
ncbi:MAG TPA: hypothetical protein VNG90_02140, partial [Candidatus Acidoferrum sp.]|nr:hypothetical protein [Candidatus Acidoferrum sp.]